jgi:hypothetical protein
MLKPVEVRQLLTELCIKLGFCLPMQEIERMVVKPPVKIEAFTNAVFVVEGMNPEMVDTALYQQVYSVVREAFSRSVLLASLSR